LSFLYLKEWEDELSGPSYIPENNDNVQSTQDALEPRASWVSKRPRSPSPSSPNSSPFRSRTHSLQTIEVQCPPNNVKITSSTTISEDELWKEDVEDEPAPQPSPSRSRQQKILEALEEEDGPPRKKKHLEFSPVQRPAVVSTPKPTERYKPTTPQETVSDLK
jgi:hypothetical protein